MNTSSIPATTPGNRALSDLSTASIVDAEPWMKDALCAQTDPEIFFPDSDSRDDARADAKKVCESCDVRSDCLIYALTHGERFGIWGGLTPAERRKIKPFPRATKSLLCDRGHDRTPSNTYTRRNGSTVCKECESPSAHVA